jgi:hypothetical protein
MQGSPGTPEVHRRLIFIGCVLFFVVSFVLWIRAESTTAAIIYYVILFIPNVLVGEYMAESVLKHGSFLSTAEAGFSVRRIILGILMVLLPFTLGYATWLAFQ